MTLGFDLRPPHAPVSETDTVLVQWFWNNDMIDDEVILGVISELSNHQLKLNADSEKVNENTLFTPLYKEKTKSKPRRNQGKNQNRRRRS